MALIQSTAIPSGASAYELEQSLRFDNGSTEKLTFTPSSAGNQKKITVSVWVKRGNLGTSQSIISAGGRFDTAITFDTSDKIQVFTNYAENYRGIQTSAVFRDTSAWYHIVASWDTNNATSTDRHILWVNGVRQAVGSEVAIPQNVSTELMAATEHTIGTGGRYQENNRLDAYLAEMHIIDGAVKVPADFGETGTYGEWKPIEYEGSYGTNGFYLPFNQDYTVEGFSTVLYPGTGASQYIGGVGFSPDLVWAKKRSASGNHKLHDQIRGTNNYLDSNTNAAEGSGGTQYLTAFSTDGFTVGTEGVINANGETFVAWNWDMGGSNASNTNGSINSTVRANPTYGQSIVSYTGNGSNTTVGHGLSSAPEMIIVKNRTNAANWEVYHSAIGNTKHLRLNLTSAEATSSTRWNDTTPTNSLFTLGTNGGVNENAVNYIAYCFHSVTGYSKIGSYTGNGSTTGPSVTLGFAPAFLLIKSAGQAEPWSLIDNQRRHSATLLNVLTANSTAVETQYAVDLNSNGFQIKTSSGVLNSGDGGGQTYVYMAFADKREYAYWLDQSGNNNDFTSNNLTESDVMVDSPTNNFATMNPLDRDGDVVVSEGNLKALQSGVQQDAIRSSFGMSTGKWYYEAFVPTAETYIYLGLANTEWSVYGNVYDSSLNWVFQSNGGTHNGSEINTSISALSGGDIVQVAYDLDAGKIWWGVNNTWILSGNPSTAANPVYSNLSGTLAPVGSFYQAQNGATFNFGQDSSFAANKTAQGNQDSNDIGDFYYTPPTGFLALCTKNLPAVAVVPSENFNTVLYTGTGNAQSVTGVGFEPSWIWLKRRSSVQNHNLFDAVRGNTKLLSSNTTDAEGTVSQFLNSFDSDGFTVGTAGNISANGETNVAWNWKAGGSGTAVPESGSGNNCVNASTHSANANAGFSIVKYVGRKDELSNGQHSKVTHGMGSNSPELIIIKNRDATDDWMVIGDVLNTSSDWDHRHLNLNNTDAKSGSDYTGSTVSNSTYFFISNADSVNTTNEQFIAYCFASVDGYSKVGSYTGNGNADGTFVYTGFRPAYVMVKRTDAANYWLVLDDTRREYNPNFTSLYPNLANAEDNFGNVTGIDFLSNGFKHRDTAASTNASGGTYIYIAFAETPFKYSNGK